MYKRYIGDRTFYRQVFTIAVPILIQNAITNFVSLLDNVMVGSIGTLEMSGVAIVNQLIFVFNLCVFGAMSGAGIFTAQFYGGDNHAGIRHTFRFKFGLSILLGVAGLVIFSFAGQPMIQTFLKGEGNARDAAFSLTYGMEYLQVMLIGLLPFALANAYSGTLRETGHTLVPMIGGVAAVVVNLVMNYILIFGHFGVRAMGVRGAAAATVISRFVELAIVAGWTHLKTKENPFIVGAYRSLHVPAKLFRNIVQKGMPLLLNEFLWASSVAVMNQCYSSRGLEVVAGMNISSTLCNLSNVVFLSLGNSVGILMGQMMGSGMHRETVRDANRKMIALSVFSCIFMGGLTIGISGLFPKLYNTTDSVRHLAMQLISISALMMPFNAYTNASYFTLRSGGQTFITFLFDSCFAWVCSVPLAFCLSRFTSISIVPMYALCVGTDLIKCVIGAVLIHKGNWIQNLAFTAEKS